jgi:hypothetical protein
MLSNKPVQVSLHEGGQHLVYVVSACVPVHDVTSNLRAPTKVSHNVTAHSAVYLVVLRTRFVLDALRCRGRFSRSRRVRNPFNHNFSDASPATSNGGSRWLRSRSPIKQRADCSVGLDGLPPRVPLSAFTTDIFPKLQADISERVNVLRFAKLAPTFSNRTRPESRRFVSRLGHGALAFLASDPSTSGRLGELCDKFPEHYDAVFRVAVCRVSGLPTSRILSTLRSPTACASYQLSVQAMLGAFSSAVADMSDDVWATAFANHLARCGGDASVHTAHS